MFRRPAMLLFVVAASGCVVPPVDLSAKRCPCIEPLVCDEISDRCVTCIAEVRTDDFRAAWATSHVIRWEWTPLGPGDALLHYELELAQNPEDLGTSAARIIDGDENPELAWYVLPRTEEPIDVVTSTHSHEHSPRTTYVARLLITDRSLCTFRSEVAVITTALDPTHRIALYDGPPPDPGMPVAAEVATLDSGELVTEHTPSLNTECTTTDEVCYQNIGWRDLDVDVGATGLTEGDFSVAFLEVELTNDTAVPSYYSAARLEVGDTFFQFRPITFSIGARTYELPLREFRNGTTVLTRSALQAAALQQVDVGGKWGRCASDETSMCTGGRVLLHRMSIHF